MVFLASLFAFAGLSGWMGITTYAETDQEVALLSEYWTEDSEVAKGINDYLQLVTDASSPDYIPAENRIAVFDLDGTLI